MRDVYRHEVAIYAFLRQKIIRKVPESDLRVSLRHYAVFAIHVFITLMTMESSVLCRVKLRDLLLSP